MTPQIKNIFSCQLETMRWKFKCLKLEPQYYHFYSCKLALNQARWTKCWNLVEAKWRERKSSEKPSETPTPIQPKYATQNSTNNSSAFCSVTFIELEVEKSLVWQKMRKMIENWVSLYNSLTRHVVERKYFKFEISYPSYYRWEYECLFVVCLVQTRFIHSFLKKWLLKAFLWKSENLH